MKKLLTSLFIIALVACTPVVEVPEEVIEEPVERRSIGQWLRDSVTLSRSARLS